ncbi:hypothetical protein RRG08_060296 [Elysia crispata]|uniref:Uncharacterized protein n=1 Tax=Elysia crispata TaxID=231223 RepID=A0AAE0Y2G2_9GAST|nr:hypothetical protein RRG08_060296 [Elysia crispata]
MTEILSTATVFSINIFSKGYIRRHYNYHTSLEACDTTSHRLGTKLGRPNPGFSPLETRRRSDPYLDIVKTPGIKRSPNFFTFSISSREEATLVNTLSPQPETQPSSPSTQPTGTEIWDSGGTASKAANPERNNPMQYETRLTAKHCILGSQHFPLTEIPGLIQTGLSSPAPAAKPTQSLHPSLCRTFYCFPGFSLVLRRVT